MDNISIIYALLKLCIDNAVLVAKFNKLTLVYKGQGDGDTKWKGWSWKLLLIILAIVIKKIFFYIINYLILFPILYI